jgi:hypothetical protein
MGGAESTPVVVREGREGIAMGMDAGAEGPLVSPILSVG